MEAIVNGRFLLDCVSSAPILPRAHRHFSVLQVSALLARVIGGVLPENRSRSQDLDLRRSVSAAPIWVRGRTLRLTPGEELLLLGRGGLRREACHFVRATAAPARERMLLGRRSAGRAHAGCG